MGVFAVLHSILLTMLHFVYWMYLTMLIVSIVKAVKGTGSTSTAVSCGIGALVCRILGWIFAF